MPSSERLLLYAADAYRLSSLLIRRIFLEGDPSIMSYGYAERTRRILLDQARPPPPPQSSSASSAAATTATRPNVAAIALLHLDREIGLARYHGVREYVSRWRSSFLLLFRRSSISSSGSSSSPDLDGEEGIIMGGKKKKSKNDNNVAKVAFLITSEQRRRLSDDLGYAHADVRTMTPREATLILEHGIVRRRNDDADDGQGGSGDWRTRLASLTREAKEEGGSSKVAIDDGGGGGGDDHDDGPTTTIDVRHKRSSGEAHRIVVKPDVAAALRSAVDAGEVAHVVVEEEGEREDGRDRRRVHESSAVAVVVVVVDPTTEVDDIDGVAGNGTSTAEDASVDDESGHPSPDDVRSSDDATDVLSLATPSGPPAYVDFASEPSELHRVKPDVAAAMMLASSSSSSSRRDRCDDDDADDDGGGDDGDGAAGWYEVIVRSPAAGASSIDERIVALFQTREEAMECVRIKISIVQGRRSRKEGMSPDEEVYLVRRRWVT